VAIKAAYQGYLFVSNKGTGEPSSQDFKDVTRKLRVVWFYGGTSYQRQINHIQNDVDILVGTSRYIKDHQQNCCLGLSKLCHVMLGEVDQILELGFAEQVEDAIHESYKTDSEDNLQSSLFTVTAHNRFT
jgi:superfamily II DNA/RNA helicase